MKRIPRHLALFFSVLAAPLVRAELLDATAEVSNAAPYVGEPFTFTLKAMVTAGGDISDADVRVYGFERYPLELGELRRQQRERHDNTTDAILYTVLLRATAPFAGPVQLTFAGQNVSQRRRGFFHSEIRRPFQMAVRPFELAARPLPDAGRPADFSGAIGSFTLDVEYDRHDVRVNDLVNRRIILNGTGESYAPAAMPVIPDPGPSFKTYAPQEVERTASPPRLILRQVIIPLDTNTVHVAAPAFSFFDPKARVYRRVSPAPARLTFLAPDTSGPDAGVVRVDFTRPDAAGHTNGLANAAKLALPSLWQGAGAVTETLGLQRRAHARLAPSRRAAVLFELEPGTRVTITERTDGWCRVVWNGRAGWIPDE